MCVDPFALSYVWNDKSYNKFVETPKGRLFQRNQTACKNVFTNLLRCSSVLTPFECMQESSQGIERRLQNLI